jgi:nitroreductase
LAYALQKGGELGVKTLSLMDTAMAAQNIMLAAYAVGLGTCPIVSFHPEAVQKIIGLPAHIYPQLLISVGFPRENPPAPRRNPNVIWLNSYADE